MENKPLVSVVIPTYNSEKYIERCLRSIKNQTYKNIEIIIVDKFSTDKTVDIAERHGAKVIQEKIKIDELIMDVISAGMEEFETKIEDVLSKIDKNKELIEKLEEECLIRNYLDNAFISKIRKKSQENAIGELDVERFMKKYISFHKGTLKEVRDDVYKVKLTDRLSNMIQRSLLRDGDYITFYRKVADETGAKLVTIDSPVMSKILSICTDPSFGGWATVKIDPRGRKGFLFVFSSFVRNIKGDLVWRALFTLFYDLNTNEVYEVNPKIVWDLKHTKISNLEIPAELLEHLDKCLETVKRKVESLKIDFEKNLKKELKRELKIKREDITNFYKIHCG